MVKGGCRHLKHTILEYTVLSINLDCRLITSYQKKVRRLLDTTDSPLLTDNLTDRLQQTEMNSGRKFASTQVLQGTINKPLAFTTVNNGELRDRVTA